MMAGQALVVVTATAAHSVPTPTPTRTGPRSRILQSVGEFKTGLPSATIVSKAKIPEFPTSLTRRNPTGKKLKRRLEDLERRAATSASPEQSHAEPVSPKPTPKTRTKQRSAKSKDIKPHSQSDRAGSYDYYSPEDRQTMFAQQCTRQLSASPPPVFSYPSMSSYDAYRQSTYSQSPVYHAAPSTYNDIAYQTEYGEHMPSLVPVLPSMQARKLAYDEDLISPFSMSYATMAGIDLCQQQAQAQSHSQHQPSTLPVHFPR